MRTPLRITVVVAILAVVAALLWFRPRTNSPESGPSDSPARSDTQDSNDGKAPPVPDQPPPAVDTTNTDPRFTRFTDGTVQLTSSLAASRNLHQSPEPSSDLEIVNQLIADYRLIYRENPVGTENAEIMAQLLGKNAKKVFFLDPELTALTADGELLDRWGSPYIFHPLKADLMDVRSLGPDRKLWTKDDLTLGLEDTEAELQLNP